MSGGARGVRVSRCLLVEEFKPCSVKGCRRRHYAKGKCNAHYLADRRARDPEKYRKYQRELMRRLRAEDIARVNREP